MFQPIRDPPDRCQPGSCDIRKPAGDPLRTSVAALALPDVAGNDVVLRVPADDPALAGTERDPSRRISRHHLEVLRRGAEVLVSRPQAANCATAIDGRLIPQGRTSPLPERFRLVLGQDALVLAGLIVRAAQPVSAVRLDGVPHGFGDPARDGLPVGAEAAHPVLSA